MAVRKKFRTVIIILLVIGISVLTVLRLGVSAEGITDLFFIYILLFISDRDYRDYVIPNSFILISLGLWGISACFVYDSIKTIVVRLLAALIMGTIMLVTVLICDRALKKDSMGGGDIKLISICTLYLGFNSTLFMLLSACVVSLIFIIAVRLKKKKINKLPFGPSIAVATVIILLYGEPLMNLYMRIS